MQRWGGAVRRKGGRGSRSFFDLPYDFGGGATEAFFIEAIEGGIVVETATLAGGDGSGAFCHHFLGEDQPFGEHVAIGVRSGEAVKAAVDLRGAHVTLFGDSFQGEVFGQVGVDKVEKAKVKIRFFLLIGGGVGTIVMV